MILIFWFVLLGPSLGGFLVAQFTGGLSIDSSTILNLLMFSYIFGLTPAIFTAILDGVLLWVYRRHKEELSASLAMLLGGLSGLLVAIGSLILDLWLMNEGITFVLGYLAIFVIPGAVCGISNKIVWRQLSSGS